MGPKKLTKAGDGEQLTLNQPTTNIESTDSEILRSILAQLATIESKLDASNKRVKEVEVKLTHAEDRIVEIKTDFKSLSDNYLAVCARLEFLEAENLIRKQESLVAKISVNTMKQRGMLQSIRVYNMKVAVKSSREAAVYLYDNLLKPALTNPVTGAHPGPFTAIEYCHLLPASPENREKFPGFNYIIKFNSRFWKFLFFDEKKKMVEAYNAREGIKCKVSHDYTYDNRLCLKVLHAATDEVKKITVRGDRILYKTSEDGDWIHVKNPYGTTPAEMASL